jgi:NADH:ubiquinone oxidoreductase subunit E
MAQAPAVPVDYRELLAPFKPNDGDLLSALHAVQHAVGWIPKEGLEAVARQLRMPVSTVFGACSFYSEFLLDPPAETTIAWCSGPACRIFGGDRIREALGATLNLPLGGKSPDGKVGLRIGQCNGTCQIAPMVWVNGKPTGPLTISSAIELARTAAGSPEA